MSKYVDTFRTQGLRRKLIAELRTLGIENHLVLEAIYRVPRHYFLDKAFVEKAYVNQAFQIGEGQTISQPYIVALQTHLLNLKRGDKVLEIGTGSGYQATVLTEMGARVYSIERQRNLYEKTTPFLEAIGYQKIKTFFGDGFAGLPQFAPFDKIIITAAAPRIPNKLLQQLKVGGCLVIPLGEGKTQEMLRLTKQEDNSFLEENFEECAFVPMLEGKNW